MKNLIGVILVISILLFDEAFGQMLKKQCLSSPLVKISSICINKTKILEGKEKNNSKFFFLPSPASPPPMMLWGIPFPKIPKFPRPGSPPPPPEQF